MDWDNVFIILFWMWAFRYVAGLLYGIYLMRKVNPATWQWETQLIVGLPFWVGYYLGRVTKWSFARIRLARSSK
jgi:hypothetical protein